MAFSGLKGIRRAGSVSRCHTLEKSWTPPNHFFLLFFFHGSLSDSCSAHLCLSQELVFISGSRLPRMHVCRFFSSTNPFPYSFSTCRHSRLRALINVQVVMTTVSAAFNATLRRRSALSAAHRFRFNAMLIVHTIPARQIPKDPKVSVKWLEFERSNLHNKIPASFKYIKCTHTLVAVFFLKPSCRFL